jgi:hypothetical protein
MMRRSVLLALVAVMVGGCSWESARTPAQPESVTLPLRLTAERGTPARFESAAPGAPENHRAHLSGDQEVFTPATEDAPTPADSHAQGQAIFQISPDLQSFDYKLIASNIENITQAHIHCGLSGTNGPVIVWLYPGPTATQALPGGAGRHDGVLAEGSIVNGAALHVRPAANSAACPGGVATFADVLAKIRAGNAYVNVHTNDGVGPTNTGPGDFPGGEVRGQF